jgi:hypothetical protein
VAGRREVNERARAQQKVAKKREVEREAAREEQANGNAETEAQVNAQAPAAAVETAAAAARRESDADVIAALRGLGCPLEQARLGAERTSALADGPIEERIKAAIKLRGQGLGRKEDFRPRDPFSGSPPSPRA